MTRTILLAGIALASMSVAALADDYAMTMKGPAAGNPYWAAVEQGAKAEGQKLGVNVIAVAPPAETEVQAQVSQMEDLIAQKVKGIALAPTDPNALAAVVDQAKAAGIPVVFIDGAGTNKDVPFVGTNNLVGGRKAGDFMCGKLPKGSEVAILQGIMSTTNGVDRAAGAEEAFKACGLKLVAEQPADWDRAKGQSITETMLAGNPGIKGIFGSNDNMALGAVEALKAAAKLNSVMVIGYDANPDAAASILAGGMTASVAQDPKKIGALGIQSLVDMNAGKKPALVTDTGTVLVTKENASSYK